MAEPKRYEIRTVADFLDIPMEKLPACFEDFLRWCGIAQAFRDTMVPEELRGVVSVMVKTDVFGWIDDGKHDAHLGITLRSEPPPDADAVARSAEKVTE